MKSFWSDAATRFWHEKAGLFGATILFIFVFVALYAPFLASSKPIVVCLDGEWYFPLFRYYFSSLFFTKSIDLFFNVLGAMAPLFFIAFFWCKKRRAVLSILLLVITFALFFLFECAVYLDPATDKAMLNQRLQAVEEIEAQKDALSPLPDFAFDLSYMTPYAKLNMVLDSALLEQQHNRVMAALQKAHSDVTPYTLYTVQQKRILEKVDQLTAAMQLEKNASRLQELKNRLQYIKDKESYLSEQKKKITFLLMPLIRPLHWEDDAGGDQALNLEMPTIELTRLNRQDLMAGLIFGARIALFVGLVATFLQLLIGIPLGLFSGYFAGRTDIVLSRFVEIWESMPAFFMLLLIITILQTKSLAVIIVVIALFSWTSTFRFVRAETFRQREIPYIDATHALGFSTPRILFYHLLPNAIVPVIALLPFDIMGAITREAGISFLGLGEELSCSWGQLMDEGRAAFPAESALLWPPAIALTGLLMGIAFVGDALITVLNPKQR